MPRIGYVTSRRRLRSIVVGITWLTPDRRVTELTSHAKRSTSTSHPVRFPATAAATNSGSAPAGDDNLVPTGAVIVFGCLEQVRTQVGRHRGERAAYRRALRIVDPHPVLATTVGPVDEAEAYLWPPEPPPEIFMGLADRPRVDETWCAVR